jgi:gluconokinase
VTASVLPGYVAGVPNRVVVMGVSGSGKSSIGRAIADRIGAAFVDADDLHPQANIDKMAAGVALDDADRLPWLESVLSELARDRAVVVACSALKRTYRDLLRATPGVMFVFLDVDAAVARDRVARRAGHFMKADMVDSQFAALERPGQEESDVVTLEANRPVDVVADAVTMAISG